MSEEKKVGLELLREPFPPHQISKLPKGTKAQNECSYDEKRKCDVCGGFHHPKIIHLDYVGHAALTDRLLDADPLWTWEPLALKDGLPAFDESGGLWIKLTVCGHTRIGYGHAAESSFKDIGSREKEVIGDALRNAAMRFGAALDLWHKGDLHVDDEAPAKPKAFEKPHKPSDGATAGLPVDLQTLVHDLSNRVRTMGAKGDIKGCCDEVDETLKDYDNKNDMMVALAEKLADASMIRNSMKAEWKARREAKA